MRLTVLEFAERYRIREADASKLLRRAALDDALLVAYSRTYKAMYTGSSEAFESVEKQHRERILLRDAARARNIGRTPKKPVIRAEPSGRAPPLRPGSFSSPLSRPAWPSIRPQHTHP